MKEPVDHIMRPRLPWRDPTELALTECGYDASKVKTLTREAYAERLKEFGRQRCAILTCMTCSQTVQRWDDWQTDPRKALGREIEWETGWRKNKETPRLLDELLAIESLISKHRGDFDSILADIRARREWGERKDARPKPVKQTAPRSL